ncbi:MAG: alpha-L-fucosidase [Bryobacteraceae bacterium]
MKRFAVFLVLVTVAAAQVPGGDRLAWYKHDKFGMFIHFAPFSNLEGEWKGQPTPPGQIAEWIMHDMRIPRAEYREMAHTFNPVKFDANAIAKLARQAGMKYLVITAKHHDGFAMYATKVNDYNLMDWTPAKRDIVKELSEACRREGIRFCVYYSHREDWDHPDGYGNFWDFDEKKQNFERYLEEKSKPQMRELLTNYGPLGLIWFDRGMDTTRHAQDFIDMVHQLQPQCLINGRVGNYGQELMGDYQNMSDNGMPNGGMDEYWETPQTLNHTWGYSRFDHDWKSSKVVIRKLVEIASKGGNYLLNIGPRADGSVPPESLEVLTGVGQWMAKNSESIYGTTANPFYDLPFGAATVKGKRLYLHVLNWPSDARLRLPTLHTPVTKAFLLTDPSKTLAMEKDGAIVLPSAAPDHADTVVAVDLAGPPQVDQPVVTAKDGVLRMDYMKAATNGKTVKRYNRSGAFHISKWTGPTDTASWMVRVSKAGAYNVRIRYAANKDWTGGGYTISIGGKSVRGIVEATGDWYEYRDFDLGRLDLTAGRHTLTVKPAAELGHYLMYFEAVELAPAGL